MRFSDVMMIILIKILFDSILLQNFTIKHYG